MLEITDNTVIITKDDGTEDHWKIYFYYRNPERNKTYYPDCDGFWRWEELRKRERGRIRGSPGNAGHLRKRSENRLPQIGFLLARNDLLTIIYKVFKGVLYERR